MANNINIVIVVVTITVISTLVIFPTNAFAETGYLYIHIRGAFLGDNLKVTAEADGHSWEWRDIFIFAEHFFKMVAGVSPGDEIDVCVTNFNTGTTDCDSGIFSNNRSADVYVNIG